MLMTRIVILVTLTIGIGFLSGCKSSEEKAQEHYESAMELIEQGDAERALVELRNVFKLNGQHKDARIAYARIEQERGNLQQAYSQYLRLVEQYPENPVGLRELSRMALMANDWAEVERHVGKAVELGVVDGDPVLAAVKVNLDYRSAVLAESDTERAAVVERARTLVQSNSEKSIARRVVISDLIRERNWEDALAEIDRGLAEEPDERNLYGLRLGVLEQLGRIDEIEALLRDMIKRFPDDQGAYQALVSLFLSRDKLDEAEQFLRDQIDPASDEPGPRLHLTQFLAVYRSIDIAISELDAMIESAGENSAIFRAARAGLEFDGGQHDTAIAEMEEVVGSSASSSLEDRSRFKIALAKMYLATNNAVGARALVEEVLKDDPNEVNALKLKAGWLIEDDKPGDALVELNSALNQAPRDSEIMTLMARAHQRAGNTELIGELLSRAVEASGNAVAESLRYANHLSAGKQFLPAEDVLLAALRRQPDNIDILNALGRVYVQLNDEPRLKSVVRKLEQLDTPQSRGLSNDLTARLLASHNRTRELNAFLENLAQGDEGDLRASVALIRSRLADGNVEGALAITRDLLKDNPDSDDLRFIEAGVLAADGKLDDAETIYRDIQATNSQSEAIWIALINLETLRGDSDAAAARLDEAMAALPDSATLKWQKAGQLEREGDIEAAIAIYEEMYEKNSSSVVVANNLASLISSYRDTPESLERAYSIARRLRGTEIPAFQDTYGWIAFRLGNYEEALEYLEPAAKALPKEAIAQYHLAEAYAALDRNDDALATYRKTLELLEDAFKPPYLGRVEAEIARLEAISDENSDGQTPEPSENN